MCRPETGVVELSECRVIVNLLEAKCVIGTHRVLQQAAIIVAVLRKRVRANESSRLTVVGDLDRCATRKCHSTSDLEPMSRDCTPLSSPTRIVARPGQTESNMKVGATTVYSAVIVCASLPAQGCNTSGALGTSRVLKVDTGTTAGFGKPFRALPLSRGEIVLTFDDGPAPGSTSQILDILARECIRATFFMIGKRAEAEPQAGCPCTRRRPHDRQPFLFASQP